MAVDWPRELKGHAEEDCVVTYVWVCQLKCHGQLAVSAKKKKEKKQWQVGPLSSKIAATSDMWRRDHTGRVIDRHSKWCHRGRGRSQIHKPFHRGNQWDGLNGFRDGCGPGTKGISGRQARFKWELLLYDTGTNLADRGMTQQSWKLPGHIQHFLPPKDSGVCNYVCLFQNFLWFILQRRSRKWKDLPRAKNRKHTLPTWVQGPGRNMWVLTQQPSMFPLCQQCLQWPGTSCDMWASLNFFQQRKWLPSGSHIFSLHTPENGKAVELSLKISVLSKNKLCQLCLLLQEILTEIPLYHQWSLSKEPLGVAPHPIILKFTLKWIPTFLPH